MDEETASRLAERWGPVIAFNMRVCRLAAGMTQDEVAKRMGTTRPAISRMESGEHLPSFTTLLRLAEVLDVHPRRLLEPPKKGRAGAGAG